MTLIAMPVAVQRHSLSIDGLSITYTFKNEQKSILLDPFATCELLQQMGLIKDFESDGFEPLVITSTNPYQYQFWVDFIKSLLFDNDYAIEVATHYHTRKYPGTYLREVNLMLQCDSYETH